MTASRRSFCIARGETSRLIRRLGNHLREPLPLPSFRRTACLWGARRRVDRPAIRVWRGRIFCVPRWFLAFIECRILRSGTTNGLCFGIALLGRSCNSLSHSSVLALGIRRTARQTQCSDRMRPSHFSGRPPRFRCSPSNRNLDRMIREHPDLWNSSPAR